MADKWVQLMSENGEDNLYPTSKMEFLWTNASPSSSFGGQTVALDLSSYSFVYLISRSDHSGTCYADNIYPIPCSNASLNTPLYGNSDDSQTSRNMTISSSSIVFAGKNTNRNATKPIKIYGIK